jgi:hypothetical protein
MCDYFELDVMKFIETKRSPDLVSERGDFFFVLDVDLD